MNYLGTVACATILPIIAGMSAGSIVADMWVPLADHHQSGGMIAAAYAAMLAAGVTGYVLGHLRK